MHRMMFEDVKLLCPDLKVCFACPPAYHDALKDHPFIDEVLDSSAIKKRDYYIYYDTTSACGRYEMRMAPYFKDNRSDIWANHCGLTLTRHNMHLRLTPQEQQRGIEIVEKHRHREGPIVIVSPISAMDMKNLLPDQLTGLYKGLQDRGLCPIGLHHYPIPHWDASTICRINLREWMAIINQADYVVSVDTSVFHCAGGFGKPVVGIFTFANATTYGRYYPTAELIQGPCPKGYLGCYNWGICPCTKKRLKPCLTEITSEMILKSVDRMINKWPIGSK